MGNIHNTQDVFTNNCNKYWIFYNNPNDEIPYFCSSKKSIIHSKPKL